MDSAHTPAWDQEATLPQARRQVRRRVEEQAAGRGAATVWLRDADPATDLTTIEQLGSRVVIGSDMVLWRWPTASIERLSAVVSELDGLVVFVEPTAGLGWRRLLQLLGRRFRRDIPAQLRAAGLVVTTQVRLWNGFHGTYVRGEARHIRPNIDGRSSDAGISSR